ncbi:LacI family DNA-binding transcriptional regulator (plasmid) [Cetobacterium somerae]|uniref:LacI family DNA-binding transcriptional regulator n=1 Tax=Cetobacterium somerae TaxID=188913 RepID=UPI002E7B0799|nr:LacI family DNA-binding transcriptional regulator [Cetobacterium somerae]WVJ02982.1 LacI family DNA-binding transcriptional regulator [Cetobacterium somerae]
MKIATIKDVAKLAGLSVSTVSRYLNNHPYITDEKREKIQKAMETLDYVPSSVATTLRSNKGKMIGVLVSRITNPYFSYLIDAMEKVIKAKGYTLLIVQTYDDEKAEFKMIEMLKQKMINGLIMCSVENSSEIIEFYCKYGPIVICNQRVDSSEVHQITTDQEKITYEAIKYLFSKGYKKIAYCTGGSFSLKSHGLLRNNGFKKAMEENNKIIDSRDIFENIHTIEDGYKIADILIKNSDENWPDAIFTGSDEVASGLIIKLLEYGKKIPEDIAVMGFDNQPFSNMVAVPITTVSQPVEALGRESAKLILSLLNNEEYYIKKEELTLKIIERKSV